MVGNYLFHANKSNFERELTKLEAPGPSRLRYRTPKGTVDPWLGTAGEGEL